MRKVSMCIIVKNDAINLKNCIESFKDHVSEIVIVDTGSNDDGQTHEVAKKYADIFEVFTECNDPETGLINDFSLARQKSLDLATNDTIMWCDSDDILVGTENINKLLDSIPESDSHSTCFLFPYEYSYDEKGKVNCLHYRERLISKKQNFHFVNPVHEVLIPKDGQNAKLVMCDDIVYKHQRQYHSKTTESGRNLRILRKYVEGKGKGDARQLYYLGLECLNNGLTEEAIQHLTHYIDISGWDDERCMASLKLIDIYQDRGDHKQALVWAFKTIEIKENWGEGYFGAARSFYYLASAGGPNEVKYWEKCVHFARLGLAQPPTKTVLFINPNDRNIEIHRYLNVALNKLGRVKEALESTELALKNASDDPQLLSNQKLYRAFLARHKAIEAYNELKSLNVIPDQNYQHLIELLHNQPLTIITDPQPCIECLSRKSNDNQLDIVFYAGQGVENWTSRTVKDKGMGGSETMMAEMAIRLVKLGHKVRIFNSCGTEAGYHDGVLYIPHERYQNIVCDVLIVSRRADVLDPRYNAIARLTLLWVHDIFALNATNELLLRADRILALSSWHKQYLVDYHQIHPEHIIQTRNGLDLSRFNQNVERDPYKCINSSSPDRSWPVLLELWPKIKTRTPKASLHLFYGFKNWLYSAQNSPAQLALIDKLQKRVKELAPLDVVYHDRVSPQELAREFLSAGCWLYPSWFSESSCISAMEAQAAGLRIVTSSIAALNETVANRGVLIPGDWTSQSYQEQFIAATLRALHKEDQSDRLALQRYARDNFSLDTLAQEWLVLFKSLLDQKKENPLTPYYPTKPYRVQ